MTGAEAREIAEAALEWRRWRRILFPLRENLIAETAATNTLADLCDAVLAREKK